MISYDVSTDEILPRVNLLESKKWVTINGTRNPIDQKSSDSSTLSELSEIIVESVYLTNTDDTQESQQYIPIMVSMYNIKCNSTWLYMYYLYSKFQINPSACFIIGYGQGSCIDSLKHYVKNISNEPSNVYDYTRGMSWFGVDKNEISNTDLNTMGQESPRVWITDISKIDGIKYIYRKLSCSFNIDLIINNITPIQDYRTAASALYYVLSSLDRGGSFISKLSPLNMWTISDINYIIICSLTFETARICVFQNDAYFTYYLVCKTKKTIRHSIHNQILSYLNSNNSEIIIKNTETLTKANSYVDSYSDSDKELRSNICNIEDLECRIKTIVSHMIDHENKAEIYDINNLISELHL
jgi:hypothetical protein